MAVSTPVDDQTGGRPAKKARASRRPGQVRTLAIFLLPFGIPFALFYLVPIGYAVYQSLFRIERPEGVFGPTVSTFAGLSQYGDVLADADFRASVLRVLVFGVVQITVMLLLALVLALLLDSTLGRFKRFFRISYFLPYAVPGVLAAIMWAFLYDPRLSPIVDLLDQLGIDVDFLGSGAVLWSIANIVTWTYAGYNMLIIYSALQAIPQELYEAARVDGCGELRTALQVKIPLVLDALILTGVFSIIGTLQLFTEPQVLRAVSTNVTSTYTPNLAAFSTASANNYNAAAAMSVTLALATFILSFGFLRWTQRRAERS